MEGAPNKLVSFPGITTHLARLSNVATNAAPEEEELGDGVGTVERRDADGQDNVESCSGADVDDTDETRDAGDDVDGVVGDCCLRMNLATKSQTVVDGFWIY